MHWFDDAAVMHGFDDAAVMHGCDDTSVKDGADALAALTIRETNSIQSRNSYLLIRAVGDARKSPALKKQRRNCAPNTANRGLVLQSQFCLGHHLPHREIQQDFFASAGDGARSHVAVHAHDVTI